MSAQASLALNIAFLKKRTSCYSSLNVRRHAASPAGRGACFRRERGAKIWRKTKIPFSSRKSLIFHKMDEGIFGNIWKKGAQIWKCLAWACKGLPGPRPGEGDGARCHAHALPIAWATRAVQAQTV
jgi:hypothetical protein